MAEQSRAASSSRPTACRRASTSRRLFDAVIHYDLNWNPTRHQQREGRVDRFGQPSPTVWSVMMFGANSDDRRRGARGHHRARPSGSRKETGVTVPVPEDSASVTSALMQAMLLRSKRPRAQGTFDFGGAQRAARDRVARCRGRPQEEPRDLRPERPSKPEEVMPEWQRIAGPERRAGGGRAASRAARSRAMQRATGRGRRHCRVHYDRLPQQLAERLAARGLTGTRAVSFDDSRNPTSPMSVASIRWSRCSPRPG